MLSRRRCCCGGPCNVTFIVDSCGTALSGATVTVKSGGTTIATGTTSVGGSVTLNIGSAGTYTVQVSKTGYTTGSQSKALTCGQTVAWDFGPSGTSLTLTDANTTLSTGAGTLTFSAGPPRNWTGSYCANYISATCTSGLSVGPVLIKYTVTCNADGTVRVQRDWAEGNSPTNGFGVWFWRQANIPNCGYTDAASCFGTNSAQAAALTQVPSSYVPFAWSGTLNAPTGGHTGDPVGGTVTLS